MAVAPSAFGATGVRITPGLPRARELARTHNLIPLTYRFIEDCETPVSAFLKLRALAPGEPAFLLESAEQGQRVGRWSFIGSPMAAILTRLLPSGLSASSRRQSTMLEQVRLGRALPGQVGLRSSAVGSASSAMTSSARSSRSAIHRGVGRALIR
jgi:anthranilate/para-aminobenzoate synthase component I